MGLEHVPSETLGYVMTALTLEFLDDFVFWESDSQFLYLLFHILNENFLLINLPIITQ